MSTVIQTRVDARLKKEVDAILSDIGLSIPEAIRLYLTQIRNKRAIPFVLSSRGKVPNEETMAAIRRSEAFLAGDKTGFKSFDSVDEFMNHLEGE